MSAEPNSKTKFVFQDFENDETYWFETAQEIAEYLTDKRIVDPDTFVAYEIGKEVKFKVVPTFVVPKEKTEGQ